LKEEGDKKLWYIMRAERNSRGGRVPYEGRRNLLTTIPQRNQRPNELGNDKNEITLDKEKKKKKTREGKEKSPFNGEGKATRGE